MQQVNASAGQDIARVRRLAICVVGAVGRSIGGADAPAAMMAHRPGQEQGCLPKGCSYDRVIPFGYLERVPGRTRKRFLASRDGRNEKLLLFSAFEGLFRNVFDLMNETVAHRSFGSAMTCV